MDENLKECLFCVIVTALIVWICWSYDIYLIKEEIATKKPINIQHRVYTCKVRNLE